jgi:DNA-binding transcriptional regulator LsrR (DeoR family)
MLTQHLHASGSDAAVALLLGHRAQYSPVFVYDPLLVRSLSCRLDHEWHQLEERVEEHYFVVMAFVSSQPTEAEHHALVTIARALLAVLESSVDFHELVWHLLHVIAE